MGINTSEKSVTPEGNGKYRFITPEIMYSGQYTVFNSEMYEEGDRYNQEICLSRIKKRTLRAEILSFCGLNAIMIFISVSMAAARLKAQTQMGLFVLLLAACAVFVILTFTQIRNKRFSVPVNTLFPVALMIGNPAFLVLIPFNLFLSYQISKNWAALMQRDGYPYFIMLVIDSKESTEDENGTQSVITETAYQFQKPGQTAEFEEISLPEADI